MCSNKNKYKKLKLYYTHIDTLENVSVTETSNSDTKIITHYFDLEGTKPNSKIYTFATVYRNDDTMINVNNFNTIKINGVGCIEYSIPFFVANSNYDNIENNIEINYVNLIETKKIISTITSSSGKLAGIKGYVETKYKNNICYTTIIYKK